MPGEILHITPGSAYKFRIGMYHMLDTTTPPVPEIDLTKEINYFNNTTTYTGLTGYDQYYSYSKVFPLFDTRRARENRQYQPDIWKNIREQEKYKAVPATTSLNYGRRPFYDYASGYNKQNVIGQFYRKKGWPTDKEAPKFTESVNLHKTL